MWIVPSAAEYRCRWHSAITGGAAAGYRAESRLITTEREGMTRHFLGNWIT
jgi:hypothetical protein